MYTSIAIPMLLLYNFFLTRSIRIITDIYICNIKIHDLCLEICEDENYRKCLTAEAIKDGHERNKNIHPEQQL